MNALAHLHSFLFFVGSALGVLLPVVALRAQSYVATPLGALPPTYPSSRANAINNAGDVVGDSSRFVSGNLEYRATRFSGTGANNVDLGTLGGAYSYAYDINDAGTIVGTASRAAPVGFTLYRATRYSGTGSDNVDLGSLGGSGLSEAQAISNGGDIVGWANSLDFQSYATRFNNSTANVQLSTSDGTIAYAVNEFSQIAGVYNGRPATFGFNGGAVTELGALGGSNGRVFAINDSGVGVGYGALPGLKYHATRFNGGYGNNTDLGTLGTGDDSDALGLNGAGLIVGQSNLTAGGGTFHAFLYVGDVMKDLNTLTTGAGGNIVFASDINDWGQIAASGTAGALRLDPVVPIVFGSGNFRQIRFVGGRNYSQSYDETGGLVTRFTFLDGVIGNGGNDATTKKNRLVNLGFGPRASAPLASDITTITGLTGPGYADTVALQVRYSESEATSLFGDEADARLGWFDNTANRWALAVNANTTGARTFVGDRAYNPATDTALGTHGVDTANNVVWAVVHRTGQFAVVDVTTASVPVVMATPTPIPAKTTTTYLIKVKAAPSAKGKALGGGTFAVGTKVTVRAKPKAGAKFTAWMEGKKAVSKRAKYAFPVTRARQLTARFE